ncbi:MAG: DUF2231 domain-containing protein [Bacteroidetes bacterium]|nr:MAG: DUF2231 domain-containing protein [Bacteroidota bacterium]
MELHPMLVHLPLGGLLLAGVGYALAWIKKDDFFLKAATLLHLAASVCLLPAIFSGRSAFSEINASPELKVLSNQHELLGYVCTWVFALLLVWRYLKPRLARKEAALFTLAYFLGMGLIIWSAHLGGQMVYRHGAGTDLMQAPAVAPPSPAQSSSE